MPHAVEDYLLGEVPFVFVCFCSQERDCLQAKLSFFIGKWVWVGLTRSNGTYGAIVRPSLCGFIIHGFWGGLPRVFFRFCFQTFPQSLPEVFIAPAQAVGARRCCPNNIAAGRVWQNNSCQDFRACGGTATICKTFLLTINAIHRGSHLKFL